MILRCDLKEAIAKHASTQKAATAIRRSVWRRMLSQKLPTARPPLLEKLIDTLHKNLTLTGQFKTHVGNPRSITVDRSDWLRAMTGGTDDPTLRESRDFAFAGDRESETALDAIRDSALQTIIEARYTTTLERQGRRREIDAFETLVSACIASGRAHAQRSDRKRATANKTLSRALALLQARACRLSTEIFELLRCRFAEAAFARWHSLHESMITSLFLVENGDDLSAAFLEFEAVEWRRAAATHQHRAESLGFVPFDSYELRVLDERFNDAIRRRGRRFNSNFGWAAKSLGIAQPGISNMEDALRLRRWRPYHTKWRTHLSTATALFNSLGLADRQQKSLGYAPTRVGIWDAGFNAAVALMMTTIAQLTLDPTMDDLITCGVIQRLVDSVESEFEDKVTEC